MGIAERAREMRTVLKSHAPKNTGNLRRSIRVKTLPSVTKPQLRKFLYNGAKGKLVAYDIQMAQYGWIIDNWQSPNNRHSDWIKKALQTIWGDKGVFRGRQGGRTKYQFVISLDFTGFVP